MIEISLPSNQVTNLELALTSVNHGYAEFGRSHTITSGVCNVDVVCPHPREMPGGIKSAP